MWNKQPVPRADRGAGAPCPPAYRPSVPGDVYTRVGVYRTSGLTRSRVLAFPPEPSGPPFAGWICVYFGWEAPSSEAGRGYGMINVLFRPPECRHWWRRKPGLGRMGEGGWCLPGCHRQGVPGGGEGTSFAAWVQRPAPRNKAKNGW